MAVVVAVGAVFFPVKVHKVGKPMYAASATIGVPPSSGKKGTSSSGDAIKEISFDTDIQTVMGNAAKAAGVKQSAVRLEKDLSISGKKGKKSKKNAGPSNTLTFSISQPTAKGSATLTNDYAKALGEYLDTSAASHQKAALKAAQEQVANIESELNAVNEQIAQLVQSGGAGASTPSGGSNKGKGGGGTRTNPTLADLETQSQSLTAAYGQAIGKEQQIQNSPDGGRVVPHHPPGHSRRREKDRGQGLGDRPPLGARGPRSRGGGGAGVGVVLLLEALDRRIKTAKRAADVFDLPVVAEIPLMRVRPASKAEGGATADAGRRGGERSHVAGRRGVPPTAHGGAARRPRPRRRARARVSQRRLVRARPEPRHVRQRVPARPASGLWVAEPVLAPPVRMAVRPTTRPPSKRQVIMVVSPGFEPTRSSVVANLAATYAEAGERALVIATQDLRQGNGFNGGYGPVPPAPDRPIGPADIEAHMVPSPIEGVCSLALGALLHGPGNCDPRRSVDRRRRARWPMWCSSRRPPSSSPTMPRPCCRPSTWWWSWANAR